MMQLNKKAAFALLTLLLCCMGYTINNLIDHDPTCDKVSQYLLLFSFAVSSYIMFRIVYKSKV
jgi:hypothetical protein